VGADFSLPHLYLVNPFPQRSWHQKTRVGGLFCGIDSTILCLAILVELQHVTDRQTDRHGHSIYPTSVVSHGTDVHESRIYFASINTMSLSVL